MRTSVVRRAGPRLVQPVVAAGLLVQAADVVQPHGADIPAPALVQIGGSCARRALTSRCAGAAGRRRAGVVQRRGSLLLPPDIRSTQVFKGISAWLISIRRKSRAGLKRQAQHRLKVRNDRTGIPGRRRARASAGSNSVSARLIAPIRPGTSTRDPPGNCAARPRHAQNWRAFSSSLSAKQHRTEQGGCTRPATAHQPEAQRRVEHAVGVELEALSTSDMS